MWIQATFSKTTKKNTHDDIYQCESTKRHATNSTKYLCHSVTQTLPQAVEAGTGTLGKLYGCFPVVSGREWKAKLELNLSRDAKITSTSTGMSARKRRSREAFMPPMNTTGILETVDKEKAELLHNCFASAFLVNSLPAILATSLLPDSSEWRAGLGLGKAKTL